jgi:hypothetical protein
VATASVRWQINRAALTPRALGQVEGLTSGIRRRCDRVRNQAVRNCPADTGLLRSSLTVEVTVTDAGPVGRIGTNLPYGRYVHDGTGVFGPKGRPIRPVRARFLRWPVTNNAYRETGGRRRYKGGSTARYAFAKQVRGVKGRPFLRDALSAGR